MSQAADNPLIRAPQPAGRPGGRWIPAVLAGLLAGVPVSVLLSFAGLLPFYLGPFFFLLFGLVVGAAMFRVAKSVRPLSVASILAACGVVTVLVFGASLWLEYLQLGPHAGKMVAKQTRELPSGTSPGEFRAAAGVKVRAHLRAEYSPGGLLGYIRWASSSGRCTVESVGAHPAEVSYALSQSPVGWTLRVAMSLVLLIGGVWSQIWPLRQAEPPPKTTEPAGTGLADSADGG